MDTDVYRIEQLLLDLHSLARTWEARGDTEALTELRTVLHRSTDFLLYKFPVPRDPRLFAGVPEIQRFPAGGVRCPTCNEPLVMYVNATVRCLLCDTVFTLVTWVVTQMKPPSLGV